MLPYFEYTDVDSAFFKEHIASRIPQNIFDVHVHCNLPGHIKTVPKERLLSDWALECGHLLPCDDAHSCVHELYPGIEYTIAGLPLPVREADIQGNNNYLADMHHEGKLKAAFMTVRPEWNTGEIERQLCGKNFAGFKPYPDMVSGEKGSEISIFSFFPHEQWEILNRHKKAVMLHLPRKERFADDSNIHELLTSKDKYPDVTIIIAHFGRSFCHYFLEEGLRKLGDPSHFYFDTAAVINPEVYDIAFTKIPPENILFGSDMPILFWHGKREWTDREYINICRENYTWNKNHKSPEEEAQYTFFLYEQMKAILDAIEKHSLSEDQKQGIFGNNALKVLRQ